MSRFFSEKYKNLAPYVPGEQPKDRRYIKLNTNESPFPPSPLAVSAAEEAAKTLQLYSDPDCSLLAAEAARAFGISEDEVVFSNGSDEMLNFAFMAFCDSAHPAVFPNITYGFYPVFAELNRVPYTEIPLRDDLTVDPEDYIAAKGTVFLANPNAPTGIALPRSELERIIRSDPDRMVIMDEAYIDFGGESCVPLTRKYDNLLVIQTFSKSRSMAGARLGFAIGNRALIRDIQALRFSTNPFNVNAMTMAAGIGALRDREYFERNCRLIRENREFIAGELRALGFEVADSETNFVFARHPSVSGETLYRELRARGILVRRFDRPETADYNRITVGTREDMETLADAVREILEGQK